MPSLNDIATIADALEKCPIAVVQDRCVVVRNRNARCRRCVDACAFGALAVAANEVSLDARRCVGCGACTGACPTEALVPLDPTDSQLAVRARESVALTGGVGVIACARAAARHVGDPDRYAEVACLARVDESAVLELASAGAAGAVLVDGNCATCKFGSVNGLVDDMTQRVRGLFADDSCFNVSRASEFPAEATLGKGERKHGSTRRGFFSDAVSAARETALTAARASFNDKLAVRRDEPQIGERLRVGASGTLPLIRMPRHERILDVLDASGKPIADVIGGGMFGDVSIDSTACNACGMCAMFCPTGALRRIGDGKPRETCSSLEFTTSDCVACGMCVDVCWKGCVSLSTHVARADLFELEPREIELAGATEQSRPLFGS